MTVMHSRLAHYGIRSLMIVFWVLALTAVLYLPTMWQAWREDKTLYIATWPLVLDPQIVQAFEQETGIKVKIAYFERSEELFAKIKATGGKGYDIIFPSDYTTRAMIEADLLAPLDKEKLSFWHELDGRLLSKYYDIHNTYSIPFLWGIFGIGINTQCFQDQQIPESWALLFDKKYAHLPLLMTDQAREAVLVAAQYLYGNTTSLRFVQEQNAVKELLMEQKKRVTIYSTERVDDMLAAGNVALAFGLGSDIIRAHLRNNAIRFIIPQEGSFLIIDSIALTRYARSDLAYQFINYLYRHDIMQHHVQLYAMCSPLKIDDHCAVCADDCFARLSFLTNVVSEETFNKIWIDLLS